MKPAQQIVLLNGNREVLDTIDFTADEFETIQHRKSHSLPAGIYSCLLYTSPSPRD